MNGILNYIKQKLNKNNKKFAFKLIFSLLGILFSINITNALWTSINAGAACTASTTVTINVGTVCGSFTYGVAYSNTAYPTIKNESCISARINRMIPPGDGTKTVYGRFRQTSSSFQNDSDQIILDTAAPVTTSNASSARSASDQTVKLSPVDPCLSSTTYCVDTSASCTPSTVGTSVPVTCAAGSLCTNKFVRYRSTDSVSHVEAIKTSAVLRIDKQAPGVGFFVINNYASNTNSTSVILNTTCASDGDGVGGIEVAYGNSAAPTNRTTCSAGIPWTLTAGDGTNTVYMRFRDSLGNTSADITDTIVLDTTTPSITDISASNVYKGQTATFYVTATDGGVGLNTANALFYLDASTDGFNSWDRVGGGTMSWDGSKYYYQVVLNDPPGTQYRAFSYVYDTLGNRGERDEYNTEFTILNQVPTSTSMSVSPSTASFSAGSRTFTSVHYDPDGATDIQYVHLLINNGLDGGNQPFYGYYTRSNGNCYIYEAGNGWGTDTSWLTLNSCSSVANGNTLTVTWNVTTKSTWNKNNMDGYIYTVDNSNATIAGGWTTVPGVNITSDNIAPIYQGASYVGGAGYVNGSTYRVKGGETIYFNITHSDAGVGVFRQYFGFNKDACTPNSCGDQPYEIKSYTDPDGTFTDWLANDSYINITNSTCVDGDGNCNDNDTTRQRNSVISSSAPERDYKINTYLYDKLYNGVGYTDIGYRLKIDKTGPSLSFTSPSAGTRTNGNITVTTSVSDARSGIGGGQALCQYNINGQGRTNYDCSSFTMSTASCSEGANSCGVQIWARDAVGNGSYGPTLYVSVDRSAPSNPTSLTCTIGGKDANILTNSTNPTLACSRAGASDGAGVGLANYQIVFQRVSDSVWIYSPRAGNMSSYNLATSSLVNGQSYYYRIRAMDTLGNANGSFYRGGEVKIDTTVPSGTYTLSPSSVTNGNVIINFQPLDNMGLKSVQLPNTTVIIPSAKATLIDPSYWSQGIGAGNFSPVYSDGSESSIVSKANPRGQTDTIRASQSNDAASDADGGWDNNGFAINPANKYRATVRIRRENVGNGRSYFGTVGNQVTYLDGTPNNNPYRGYPIIENVPRLADERTLRVGYIYPSTYAGAGGEGGIYFMDGSKSSYAFNDWKWASNAYYGGHRTFLYYSTSTSERQYRYRPRFEVVDGTEPSIATLLRGGESLNPVSYTTSANGSYNFTVNDIAGNSDVVGTTVSNIDTTAPSAPSFVLSTTGITNSTVYVMPQYNVADTTVNIYNNGNFTNGLTNWVHSADMMTHSQISTPRGQGLRSVRGAGCDGGSRPILYNGTRNIQTYQAGINYNFSFKYRVTQGSGIPFNIGRWISSETPTNPYFLGGGVGNRLITSLDNGWNNAYYNYTFSSTHPYSDIAAEFFNSQSCSTTIEIADVVSTPSTMEYNINGGGRQTYTGQIPVTTNGTIIQARYKDFAGNTSAIGTTTVNNIDTTAPTISFSGSTPTNGSTLTVPYFNVLTDITELNLGQFIWKLNGTNYPIYDSGLVLMMNFDNVSALGENATTVKDLSQHGNHGTASGGPTWTSNGKFGGAYNFDGVNDSLSTVNNLGIVGNTVTAQMRIKTTPVTALSSNIIGEYGTDSNVNSSFIVVFNDGSYAGGPYTTGGIIVLEHSNSGYLIKTSSKRYDDNKWHQITVTIDRNILSTNQMNLYIDGELDQILSNNYVTYSTSNFGNHQFFVGSRNNSIAFFSGEIDELKIYNRALSSGEISQLYNSNLSKYALDKRSFQTNFTGLSQGIYTYSGTVIDKVGYQATVGRTTTVNLDSIPPIFTFANNAGNECVAGSLSITNASDNIGLHATPYSFDGSTWNTTTTTNITAQQPGTQTRTGYVRDANLNQTVTAATYTFNNIAPSGVDFTGSTNVGNNIATANWKTLSSASEGACGNTDIVYNSIVTQGTKGTCSVIGNNITYTPNNSQVGNDYCIIQVKDNENSTMNIRVGRENIDTESPTGAPTCTDNVYFSGSLSVSCTVGAGGTTIRYSTGYPSAIDPTSSSLVWSNQSFNNSVNLRAISCDDLNNCNTALVTSKIYTKDTLAPTTTISDTNPNWRNTNISFTLNGTDAGVGGENTYYKVLNGDLTCSAGGFTSYSTAVSVLGVTNDAIEKTVCYYSTDSLGNTETIQKQLYKIDKSNPSVVAPTIHNGTRFGNYFKGTVGLQSSLSDIGAGVKTDSCQSQLFLGSRGSWNTTTQVSTTLCQYNNYTPDQDFSIKFLVNDDVGNTGTSNQSDFTYDNTAPIIGIPTIYAGTTYNNNFYKGTINIQATASDTLSDINSSTCEYSTNNGASRSAGTFAGGYCQATNIIPATSITLLQRAKDNVGNTGTSNSKAYAYDNTTPTTTDDSNDTNRYTDDSAITLTPTDGTGAGVAYTTYCIADSGSTCNPMTEGRVGTSVVITGTDNIVNVKYIRYFSTDNLNSDESIKNSNTIKIDKQKPTVTLSSPSDGTLFQTGSVPFNRVGSDGTGSGISGYILTIFDNNDTIIRSGFTSTTTKTLEFYNSIPYKRQVEAIDMMGNTGNSQIGNFIINLSTDVIIPNNANTGTIIAAFTTKGYTQATGGLTTVAANTLVGNIGINLSNVSSGKICPQVPIVIQSSGTLLGSIGEVEFTGCFYVQENNGEAFTGTISPILFQDKISAFELINYDIKTVINVGSDLGLHFKDNNLNDTYATVRIPAPNTNLGDTVNINYSQNGNTWNYLTSANVTSIQSNNYVVFQTNHFTYFALGSQTGNFVINNDTIYTSGLNVTLNMSVSGAVQMRFGNTSGERDAATRQTYSNTTSWTLTGAGGDGTKTVYAMFHDGNGQTGFVSDSIILDSSAPILQNMSPLSGDWINTGSTNLVVSGNDNGGIGVSGYIFQLRSGNTILTSGFIAGNTGFATSLQNHTYSWNAIAIDALGNQSSETPREYFSIDYNEPTINLTSPVNGSTVTTYDNSLILQRSANDGNGIGISGYSYQISAGLNFNTVLKSGTVYTNTTTISGLTGGTYYRRVKAWDNLGNSTVFVSGRSFTLVLSDSPFDTGYTSGWMFWIDTIAPIVELIAPVSGSTTNFTNINFVWSGNDGTGSGISGYIYEIATGSDFAEILYSGETLETGISLTGLEASVYYRHVKAYDPAGNTGNFTDTSHFTINGIITAAEFTGATPASGYTKMTNGFTGKVWITASALSGFTRYRGNATYEYSGGDLEILYPSNFTKSGDNNWLFTWTGTVSENGAYLYQGCAIDAYTLTGCTEQRTITYAIALVVGSPASGYNFGSLTVSSIDQPVERQISGDNWFYVDDPLGSDSGYATFITVTDLTGATETLSRSNVYLMATGINTLAGDANTNVTIDPGLSSYQAMTGAYTFIKRDLGVNNGLVGRYGIQPRMKIIFPAYQKADNYHGTIVITLQEN